MKTPKKILAKHFKNPYTESDIIAAMEEYASQFQPSGMGWISVEENQPEYYKTYLCLNNQMLQAICWRASTGEEDIYTIQQTDRIFENVTHWMPLPPLPETKINE